MIEYITTLEYSKGLDEHCQILHSIGMMIDMLVEDLKLLIEQLLLDGIILFLLETL
jgi:hypothetical protein